MNYNIEKQTNILTEKTIVSNDEAEYNDNVIKNLIGMVKPNTKTMLLCKTKERCSEIIKKFIEINDCVVTKYGDVKFKNNNTAKLFTYWNDRKPGCGCKIDNIFVEGVSDTNVYTSEDDEMICIYNEVIKPMLKSYGIRNITKSYLNQNSKMNI